MKKKPLNFHSRDAYRKYLAFGHIHGKFKKPGNQEIKIRGHIIKVKHGGY